MRIYDEYNVIIFDCDGVILDSNNMKIEAMREALSSVSIFSANLINDCVLYFRNNFGKSRFHHVDVFLSKLNLDAEEEKKIRSQVLTYYSDAVDRLYLMVPEAPGVRKLLTSLANQALYVASGSEESQLKRVLDKRDLSKYFACIYGSPISKQDNLSRIKMKHPNCNILMIGDALADLQAAETNKIDFAFYEPLSNNKTLMLELAQQKGFPILETF